MYVSCKLLDKAQEAHMYMCKCTQTLYGGVDSREFTKSLQLRRHGVILLVWRSHMQCCTPVVLLVFHLREEAASCPLFLALPWELNYCLRRVDWHTCPIRLQLL